MGEHARPRAFAGCASRPVRDGQRLQRWRHYFVASQMFSARERKNCTRGRVRSPNRLRCAGRVCRSATKPPFERGGTPRPGRCWPRLAASLGRANDCKGAFTTSSRCGCFSARARKTAPVAGCAPQKKKPRNCFRGLKLTITNRFRPGSLITYGGERSAWQPCRDQPTRNVAGFWNSGRSNYAEF